MTGIIIVAFNNHLELKNLLLSLKNQNYTEYLLYIVDNSNNDIAQKNLKIINELFSKEKFVYFKTDNNLGSAEGFYLGMKKAYENQNNKWFWLLDQDMEVTKETLINMIEFGLLNKINALTSKTYCIKDREPFPSLIEENIFGKGKIVFTSKKNFLCPTHGFLINRSILNKIGFYDYTNFYIGFEDYDYCKRIYKIGEKIGFADNGIVFHPSPKYNYKRINQIVNNKFRRMISEVFFPISPVSFFLMNKKNIENKRVIKAVRSKAYIVGKYNLRINVLYALIVYLIKIGLLKILKPQKYSPMISLKETIEGIKKGIKERKELKFF